MTNERLTKKKCGPAYFLCRCLLMLSFLTTFSQTENNPFIPGKIPDGFVYAQTPEYYGTYDHPQKNGTIYDYIDGGGEVYIKHGFHSVTHIILKKETTTAALENPKNQDTITLDIYQLGSAENAKAAYADEAICPPGFSEKNIGAACKTYHYEPDYLIYFIKGKYLIYLGLSNDTLTETLTQFAEEIYKTL
ncbi:MAG: hypothetical protein NT166_27010 [Candidatus Aminicenantes bacterium]|nr:hypothetical protein [Candidatus Aminicenantes bacterium]